MADPADKAANVEHSSFVEETTSNDQFAKSSPDTSRPILEQARARGLQPPEIIANLTLEQRQELEARLTRKVDLRLMPTIVIMYIMNYIDRNNIAAAKLANIEKDLNLPSNSTEYQTAVSILFVGYDQTPN